ncbi:PQQ-dependent sugar dehydrogenase [Bacterioplanoides sp.]|uniref:PQQ-dependent sugar dehydrogenase n=1 Tax=Bacterioplanoides sp. TaxID=2066072 RepID=UPI003B595069
MNHLHTTVSILLFAFLTASCGTGSAQDKNPEQTNSNTPKQDPVTTPDSKTNPTPRLVTLYPYLERPWGMDFLPDGRMLISQRQGSMVLMNNTGTELTARLTGLPAVKFDRQGGLLDVAVDPDFSMNRWIYWSYSESDSTSSRTGTAVARGKLSNNHLTDVQVIYRQTPKISASSQVHYGSRLVFSRDKTLFITLGDRGQRDLAQDLSTSIGKVVRINRDGSIPADSPTFSQENALPEIWSYGHRNPQGAALHPTTGELWLSEHGPQGGDEINRVIAGQNYGWPIKSYGCEYSSPVSDNCRIGGGVHAPDYIEPISTWVPVSTAPAGIAFYSGTEFPEWRGDLFVAALRDRVLWHLDLTGTKESGRKKLFTELDDRIRDVNYGPDGKLYLLTDAGRLIKVTPE